MIPMIIKNYKIKKDSKLNNKQTPSIQNQNSVQLKAPKTSPDNQKYLKQ